MNFNTVTAAALAISLSGCAITKPPGRTVEGRPSNPLAYTADVAQSADAATAVAATVLPGFMELNPLGLMLVPVKFRMAAMAENNTSEDCESAQKAIAIGGLGPAAWGAVLFAGGTVATAGAALVAAPAALWASGLLDKSAEARCADARPLTKKERTALTEKMDADRAMWGF